MEKEQALGKNKKLMLGPKSWMRHRRVIIVFMEARKQVGRLDGSNGTEYEIGYDQGPSRTVY